jgi:hypothetical protein
MNKRSGLFLAWLTAMCLCLVFAACVPKETGDDDDDDSSPDDDAPTTGVGSYQVHLNMVSVTLGEDAPIGTRSVYDADDEPVETDSILVSDLLVAIDAFAEDVDKFDYRLVNYFETASGVIGSGDLADVAFYEAEEGNLCVGWLSAGHTADALCHMEQGWIDAIPKDDAFTWRTPAYINERDGDQPSHLGETVALRAPVIVGANTIVSGDYLKTYVQEDGWGVKVFADAGATVDDQGYDGSLIGEVETFIGDRLFVLGRVTVHDGMVEFVPKSAYHLAVIARGETLEPPATVTIDALSADRFRYAASLVRLDDVAIVDVNPDDATTDWPVYGEKSKEIRIQHTGGGAKMGMPVYERTGLPGSAKPADGFNVVGAVELDGESTLLMPRRVEDINPGEPELTGEIEVAIAEEDRQATVDLSALPVGFQTFEEKADPVAVVSLASIIDASGLTRSPKLLTFKPVAYDGRQPFDVLSYDECKSGVLYQGEPIDSEPAVNSYFWPGMNLSDIYYLNGVTDIDAFRVAQPPEEGEAEYGEGVTLQINGHSFVVNFDALPHTTYDGQDAIAAGELIVDEVVKQFTMNGSFTVEQIKLLYDYRFVANDDGDEATVRFADLAGGYLIPADDPYILFPELGNSYRVDRVLVVDMMRFIQVDFGDGGDPTVVYLRDCATEPVDVGEGQIEDVVFFRTVLEEAGIDTSQGMYLYDFWLIASDDFISTWTYAHNHLVDMYFRPYENRGYTVDPDLFAYGGRVSTKAVNEIELHDVPQEAPSVPVIIDEQTLWGSDANTCQGCHFKEGELNLPIDCTSCHTVPTR